MEPTVLHIFSGDLWAGAEVMIHSLLTQMRLNNQARLIALSMNEGVLTGKLRAAGVETQVISEARFSFPSLLLRASRLFRARRIDVIHSHRYKENLLAFFLGQFLHVTPLIATIHGLPEQSHSQKAHTNLVLKLDRFLLRRLFSNVVAVSHDMKRRLVKSHRFSPGHVSVIHNGTRTAHSLCRDDGMSSPAPCPHAFHIGSVGRLVPVKDFELFLRIAAEITRQCQNVRFSILGDGPCKREVEEKADRLGLNGCFSLLSTRQDAGPYYRTLDVYLNTSLHEGIPMSVLEAMAYGVPVVAAKVGGLSEVIADGRDGFLVEGRNPEDYVRRCVDLIENPSLRYSIRESALRRVESDFSAGRMAREYNSLYLSLLGHRSHAS